MLGDKAVGKTSVIKSFFNESFEENLIMTIGIDFKIKEMEIEGRKIKL